MTTEELAQIVKTKQTALKIAQEEHQIALDKFLASKLADAGFKKGDIVEVPLNHWAHRGKMCRIELLTNYAQVYVTILRKDGSDSSFNEWIPLSKLCESKKEAPND